MGRQRTIVYNPPTARFLSAHLGKGQLRRKEHAAHVDIQHVIKVVNVNFVDQT